VVVPSRDFVPALGTFLLELRRTGDGGLASLLFLEPDPGSAATVAAVDGHSATLSVGSDLAGRAPLRVAEGSALTLDWSGLDRDARGLPLAPSEVSHLVVARYDETPEELAVRLPELDALAAERWELAVAGSSRAELAALPGETPFAGVDGNGTWLLALTCTGQDFDLPCFLVRLEPAQST
jgi:hypothetical protein